MEKMTASASKMDEAEKEFKDKEEDVNSACRRTLLMEEESRYEGGGVGYWNSFGTLSANSSCQMFNLNFYFKLNWFKLADLGWLT